jgi:predicted Zn-dependent protease
MDTRMRLNNGLRARLNGVLLLALTASTIAGCAVNPVTGQRQLALISEAQEIQIGQEGAAGIEAQIGLVADEALQNYVQELGMRMARASERPELPWRFRVLDDPTPNAFALPGGFIYVTRGLLALMNSEAELTSVIGHEIGHVTARHSVTMMSRAQLAQIGLGVGMIFVPGLERFGGLASGGMELLFLSYGRDAERQADDLGFNYALAGGWDVREMPNVFASLQRAGEMAGQSPLPNWAASHPNPAERIQRIQQRLAQIEQPLTGLRVGGTDYLQRLNQLVYGDNPRDGFFREGLFLHPDLAFQIRFPQGWATQNLPQAVVAVSPQQDGAFQLTIAQGVTTADQAMQRFAAQQGLAVTRSSRETINGLPATVGEFQAQTEQGPLLGIVAFITHGGRVYQVIGYSPAQRYAALSPAFRQTLGSFARVTDAQVLNVQPNRIRIERVPQAMTLAQFQQRFPSVIPITELALINQVAGPDAQLAAGTSIKRVTGN